jgi:glucose/mannose-6-phosphate isomerase
MGGTVDESLLDAVDRLTRADRDGLLHAMATAGAQVRQGRQLAEEAGIEGYLSGLKPRAVLFAGDAPAETVARAVAALAGGPATPAPIVLHREPVLPVWAGPLDLLIAAAYVGGDQRVLAAVEGAIRRGVPVVATGPSPSPLEEACMRGRAPYVPAPAYPVRAALWSLLAPTLYALGRSGVASIPDGDLPAAADVLDAIAQRCSPTNETFGNPAKTLALELGGSLPVVWGTSPLASVAAYQAVGQLAGNATLPAVWGVLPTAAHQVGGLFDAQDATASTEDLFRDRVEEAEPRRPRLVLLRDLDESGDVRLQAELLSEGLNRRGVPVTELMAEEGGPVTRMASLIGLLDFATVYTGLALGVDPSGVRTGQVQGVRTG